MSVDTHHGGSCSLGTLLARARALPAEGQLWTSTKIQSVLPVSCHLSSSSVLLSCSLQVSLFGCSAKLLLVSFQISKQVLAKKCWALWVNLWEQRFIMWEAKRSSVSWYRNLLCMVQKLWGMTHMTVGPSAGSSKVMGSQQGWGRFWVQ